MATFAEAKVKIEETSRQLDIAVDWLHELRESPQRIRQLDDIATLLRHFVEDYC